MPRPDGGSGVGAPGLSAPLLGPASSQQTQQQQQQQQLLREEAVTPLNVSADVGQGQMADVQGGRQGGINSFDQDAGGPCSRSSSGSIGGGSIGGGGGGGRHQSRAWNGSDTACRHGCPMCAAQAECELCCCARCHGGVAEWRYWHANFVTRRPRCHMTDNWFGLFCCSMLVLLTAVLLLWSGDITLSSKGYIMLFCVATGLGSVVFCLAVLTSKWLSARLYMCSKVVAPQLLVNLLLPGLACAGLWSASHEGVILCVTALGMFVFVRALSPPWLGPLPRHIISKELCTQRIDDAVGSILSEEREPNNGWSIAGLFYGAIHLFKESFKLLMRFTWGVMYMCRVIVLSESFYNEHGWRLYLLHASWWLLATAFVSVCGYSAISNLQGPFDTQPFYSCALPWLRPLQAGQCNRESYFAGISSLLLVGLVIVDGVGRRIRIKMELIMALKWAVAPHTDSSRRKMVYGLVPYDRSEHLWGDPSSNLIYLGVEIGTRFMGTADAAVPTLASLRTIAPAGLTATEQTAFRRTVLSMDDHLLELLDLETRCSVLALIASIISGLSDHNATISAAVAETLAQSFFTHYRTNNTIAGKPLNVGLTNDWRGLDRLFLQRVEQLSQQLEDIVIQPLTQAALRRLALAKAIYLPRLVTNIRSAGTGAGDDDDSGDHYAYGHSLQNLSVDVSDRIVEYLDGGPLARRLELTAKLFHESFSNARDDALTAVGWVSARQAALRARTKRGAQQTLRQFFDRSQQRRRYRDGNLGADRLDLSALLSRRERSWQIYVRDLEMKIGAEAMALLSAWVKGATVECQKPTVDLAVLSFAHLVPRVAASNLFMTTAKFWKEKLEPFLRGLDEQGAQQLRELGTELQCWHAEHMADFTAADSYNTRQDQRQQTTDVDTRGRYGSRLGYSASLMETVDRKFAKARNEHLDRMLVVGSRVLLKDEVGEKQIFSGYTYGSKSGCVWVGNREEFVGKVWTVKSRNRYGEFKIDGPCRVRWPLASIERFLQPADAHDAALIEDRGTAPSASHSGVNSKPSVARNMGAKYKLEPEPEPEPEPEDLFDDTSSADAEASWLSLFGGTSSADAEASRLKGSSTVEQLEPETQPIELDPEPLTALVDLLKMLDQSIEVVDE